jgi:hypothetical protein
VVSDHACRESQNANYWHLRPCGTDADALMMHEDIRAGRELGQFMCVSGSERYGKVAGFYPFGGLASAVRTMLRRRRRAVKFPSEGAGSLPL